MVLKISFWVFMASLVAAAFLPEYHKAIAQVTVYSFSIGFWALIIRAFRRRTVNVVIIEDRTKQ